MTEFIAMTEPIDTQPGKPCPICARPSTQAMRPFCSKRCADIDLNRWLKGVYVLPSEETPEDEMPDMPPPSRNETPED